MEDWELREQLKIINDRLKLLSDQLTVCQHSMNAAQLDMEQFWNAIQLHFGTQIEALNQVDVEKVV